MALSTFDCIASITQHSAGFADVTRDHLDASVEHCPGWSVADLVRHLTEVHWLWATIVEGRLDAPPDDGAHPPRTDDVDLVDAFKAGALRLVETLREADQTAHCWTWAAGQQDVAFVTRHQVQEVAVHHWDAVHAAGGSLRLESDIASDSVEEFLHFSVATDDNADDPHNPKDPHNPDDPVTPALDGAIAFVAADTGTAWTVRDGTRPGTAVVTSSDPAGVAQDVPVVRADASDLVLWLYDRVPLDSAAVPVDLLGRFRALCSTD